VGDDFEDSAERVSGFENLVDFFFHALLGFGVGAVQQDFFAGMERANLSQGTCPAKETLAGGDHVTEDFDAEFAQEKLGDRSDGDAGGGFAGGGAFENVAGFGEVVLQGSGEVGVAGAGRRDALVFRGIAFADRQRFLPVFPVAVFELDGNGRSDGHAVAYAGKNVGGVALDLHAAAAAVALLATPEFPVEERPGRFSDRRAGRKGRRPELRRGTLRQ
jgi:hypothetical protein